MIIDKILAELVEVNKNLRELIVATEIKAKEEKYKDYKTPDGLFRRK